MKIRTIYITTFALLVLTASVWADNTGEQNPASSANEGSPATAWTNIDSVFASDDQRAEYNGGDQDSLYITNFTMGVTAGATIDSFFVTIEAHGIASQAVRRRVVHFFVKDGKTPVGTQSRNYNFDQTTDNTIRLSGDDVDDPLYGTTWTAAEVNSANFGIVLWKTASQAGAIRIDHVTIYCAYTPSGGAPEVTGRRRRISQ